MHGSFAEAPGQTMTSGEDFTAKRPPSEREITVRLTDLAASAADALAWAREQVADATTPTVRLGVTGLSRAGKTVFITAFVRALTVAGRLPYLGASAEGRLIAAHLEPQPDDAVPRFDYEAHVARLEGRPPEWPDSTRHISELRVTLHYAPSGALAKALGTRRLHVDIVDYPGEWLLDLALLEKPFAVWSAEALAEARSPRRAVAAQPFLEALAAADVKAAADEQATIRLAAAFTAYLAAVRAGQVGAAAGLAMIGPGRFLMPGELAGSPLLTFAPLDVAGEPRKGSLAAMMARRYESYKEHVVRPFFRDHFARLDRQIVLVDALAALDGGREAIDDLTRALEASLQAFRPGTANLLARLVGINRVDRILFAATKADHLPAASHDRLEAVLRVITDKAAERARFAGAEVGVAALAALRATREAEARSGGETLAVIRGTPLAGERIAGKAFDGTTEAAIFPGDLPADPATALTAAAPSNGSVRIVRFRPPLLASGEAEPEAWPHVRLDRAIEFLIGDRLA